MKVNKCTCGMEELNRPQHRPLCQLCKLDKINPQHYKQGKIEVYDFIQDQKLDYATGNIIKYVCRYRFKNGLEDLKKAQWYLNKKIVELEKVTKNEL